MSFGARLAEERKRLGLKQADFAGLVGTDVPKQSLYENDRRELRAEYLARLVDADVDVVYILSGRRSGAEALGEGASQLLSAYLGLPPELRQAVEEFVGAIRHQFTRGPGTTLHGARVDYRPEERAD
ncbi:MAG TPA: helix-turn-helix transcriptional regulator [Allosphingosinicella sp.]|nr:helix-turn-helix transcriptional regulator [Allosphingosinicella sp.]